MAGLVAGLRGRLDVARVKNPSATPAPCRGHRVLPGHVRARAQEPELADEQNAASAPTPKPTLYLHGADDGCMGVEPWATRWPSCRPRDPQFVVIADAGHFLQLEQPDVVNRLILDFLALTAAAVADGADRRRGRAGRVAVAARRASPSGTS